MTFDEVVTAVQDGKIVKYRSGDVSYEVFGLKRNMDNNGIDFLMGLPSSRWVNRIEHEYWFKDNNRMANFYIEEDIKSFKDIVKLLDKGYRIYNIDLDMEVLGASNPIGRGELFLGDFDIKRVFIVLNENEVMNYDYIICKEDE